MMEALSCFASFPSYPPLPLAWLQTRHGAWSPLAWTAAMLVALALAWLFRACGRKDSAKGGEAATPFVSANPVRDPEEARVPSSHLYWGFLHAMERYYRRMRAFHSGILSDYVLWFLLTVGVLFVAVAMF